MTAAFAATLRRAMKQRGGTIKATARELAVTEANLHHYRKGHTLPSLETAQRMAEHLDSPALVSIVLDARTHACRSCGTSFVDSGHGGPRRVFCSTACGDRDFNRRVRQPKVQYQAKVDRNDLARHRDAVGAFCLQCEPEGLCRDDECHLRPVSRLPFVPLSSIRVRAA
jgi:transcriptional regulator with XRE-family HTH domain